MSRFFPQFLWIFAGLLLILLLSACGSSEAQQTLVSNHAQAGTQLADLRVSATVLAARAQTTLDFAQTDAALAATQSQFLESTLVNEGVSAEQLATERARILSGEVTLPPGATPEATASSPAPANPNPAGQPTPTAGSNGPRLENPQLATGTDANGCAVGATTQFRTDSREIYVVAIARDIPANSITFEARWFREGQPIGPVYSYRPDYDVTQECVWFFVDPTDFAFEPGSYSVVIDMQGEPAFEPLPFTIVEAGSG